MGLVSDDHKIKTVLKKIEAVRATDSKLGDVKFIVGRIAQSPAGKMTVAPLKNVSCAYFKLTA